MNQDNEVKLPSVPEATVVFNAITDRSVYRVVSEDNPDRALIEITGYDLQINFNYEYLRSYEDVSAAAEGISTMFKEIMLERLLSQKQTPQ